MSTSVDRSRLQATLGDPRLARLVGALRRRLELGNPLEGILTLANVTPDERTALDELLGRRPTVGASLAINLAEMAATLREAAICEDLAQAVEALVGAVPDRRAAQSRHEAAWAAVWDDARRTFARWAALGEWLDDLAQTGTVKRLCDRDPEMGAALLREIATVICALPAKAEPLAAFAARLFGDAHALDPGTGRSTLAVRAVARLGGIAFADDAEGRRAAWASVGVMCDELSTPTLVYNLPALRDTRLARLLRCARAGMEPMHISLRLLLRYSLAADPALANRDIFICENPTLVSLAANDLGGGCAPLVCLNGQFATPSLVLLRQLRDAGARLHYHGDFDPAGLAIAARAMRESGARPWRYGAADYRAAAKGNRFAGEPGPTPWDPALGEAMRSDGRSVHEEAVFGTLAADLRPGPSAPRH